MRTRTLIPTVLVAAISAGCGDSKPKTDSAAVTPQATPATALPAGESMLPVPDGKIWYKKSGTGGGTPLILVHGGPGFNSFYLKPLEALGSEPSRRRSTTRRLIKTRSTSFTGSTSSVIRRRRISTAR